MKKTSTIILEIPIEITELDTGYLGSISKESAQKHGYVSCVVTSNTKAGVIDEMIKSQKALIKYYSTTTRKYYKWSPFLIGPGGIGGRWFTIFGVGFLISWGKVEAPGWWNIPGTPISIKFINRWK